MRKDYVWNPSAYDFEIDEYLKSAIGDSVITCDKNTLETMSINLNDKKATCNMVYYILHTILLANINCYYLLSLHKLSLKTKRHYHVTI